MTWTGAVSRKVDTGLTMAGASSAEKDALPQFAVHPANAMTTTTHTGFSRPLATFDLAGSIPFLGVHVACVLALFVPFGWTEVLLCAGLYFVRMFGVTAGYHRYFAHRSFKTSRVGQFLLATLAVSSAQKGVLWWAAHHRSHHTHSDTERDLHSPVKHGFWWAHVGWILCREHLATDFDRIKDYARFPELRWLNRWHLVPYVLLCVVLFFAGGLSWLVWGGFISTVVLWHSTFMINSLAHVVGKRRFETRDDSRNNWLLALLTGGEGWHNNHHRSPGAARQGMYWWEIDTTYSILSLLAKIGVVWDLRPHPQSVYDEAEGRGRERRAA